MKHADHWFYVPESSTENIEFPLDEAVHATKVLRLQVGDRIQWLDGCGGRYLGQISAIAKKSLRAHVLSYTMEKKPAPTVLAVGQLHDSSRLEWLVEKATELGVTEILLMSTTRVERTRYKMSRLEAKVVAAVKQSGRAWVPTVREVSFSEALKTCNDLDIRYIAHCYDSMERDEGWVSANPLSSVCMFIGPEGDFTTTEVELAVSTGYDAISLGKARLRTETAALAGMVRLRGLLA